jgi:hypothetical protein
LGPFNAKNDRIINRQPRVKHIANFRGITTITGRNMIKAMKMKKMPVARSMPKYRRAFPEGRLLAADCTFPGKSRTPFDTMLKVPSRVSLADLNKGAKDSGTEEASRSSPVCDEADPSGLDEEAPVYAFHSASREADGCFGCCSSLSFAWAPVNHERTLSCIAHL